MKKISFILSTLVCTLTFSYGDVLEIYPQVDGEIISKVKENQTFKKGETLISFDARQIETKIAQYQGIVNLKKTLLDDANKILTQILQ